MELGMVTSEMSRPQPNADLQGSCYLHLAKHCDAKAVPQFPDLTTRTVMLNKGSHYLQYFGVRDVLEHCSASCIEPPQTLSLSKLRLMI